MFNSKKAKYFAAMIAATATAAIPVFAFSPTAAAVCAGIAAVSTALVNFFGETPAP